MKVKDLVGILENYDPEMEVIIPYREFHDGECIDISWTERLSFEMMESKDIVSVTREGNPIYVETEMLVIVPEEYDIIEKVEDPPDDYPG